MHCASVAGPEGNANDPAKTRDSSGSAAPSTAPESSVIGTPALRARSATT
jgi:hypothetical protein